MATRITDELVIKAVDQASKPLSDVANAATKAGHSLDGAGRSAKQSSLQLSSLASGLVAIQAGYQVVSSVVNQAIDAWRAIGSAISHVIELSEQQAQVDRRLIAALRLRTDAHQAAFSSLQRFNDQIQQRIGIGDEELQQLEGTLLGYGLLPSEIEAATKATIGFANVTGGSLTSAAATVAKAFQGQTDMLRRYGIVANSTEEATAKLAEMFTLAEANSGSLTSSLGTINANLGDLQQSVGGAIQASEPFRELLQTLTDASKGLRDVIARNADGLTAAINGVGTAFSFAARNAQYFGAFLGPMGSAIGTVVGQTSRVAGATADYLVEQGRIAEAFDMQSSVMADVAAQQQALADAGVRAAQRFAEEKKKADESAAKAAVRAAEEEAQRKEQVIKESQARLAARAEDQPILRRRNMQQSYQEQLEAKKKQDKKRAEDEAKEKQRKVDEQFSDVAKKARFVADPLSQVIRGAIFDTKNLGRVFGQVIEQMAMKLASSALLSGLSMLFGGGAAGFGSLFSGFLGFKAGGTIPHAANGMMVGGYGGGDRRLIAAESGELVVRRELAPAAMAAGFGPAGHGRGWPGGSSTVINVSPMGGLPSSADVQHWQRRVVLPANDQANVRRKAFRRTV